MSTFVTDEFLRHCMMPSLRWIGPELVRSLTRDDLLFWEPRRDANSSDGLNLFAWSAALCPPNEGDRSVQMELPGATRSEQNFGNIRLALAVFIKLMSDHFR